MITIETFHSFFFFLATTEGILFRSFLESFVLLVILYMTISEFLRTRTKQMFWFMNTFLILAAIRTSIAFILATKVFGNSTLAFEQSLFPLFEHVMGLLALLALWRALLYFQKKRVYGTGYLMAGIFLLGAIMLPIWNNVRYGYNYFVFWGNVPFEILQLTLLTLCAHAILTSKNPLSREYLGPIACFTIAPLISLLNHIFYSGSQFQLQGAMQPFMFIAALLFGRALYLTMANKAHLYQQIHSSKQQYEQEKELNRLKDEFVSTVSHELRTPLTTMKLYTGLLHSGDMGNVTKEQQETVEIIDTEINRLTDLINDLLDVSKFRSGNITLNKEPFDLVHLLKTSPHNSLGQEKNVLVHFDTPSKYTITADKARIHQLYINLLSNAIKFSSQGETIRVTIKKQHGMVQLSVQDRGPGIPKEKLQKVFEPFYQVHHQKAGTGLGLAICKHIVELHQGTIELTSKGGLHVQITLPQGQLI